MKSVKHLSIVLLLLFAFSLSAQSNIAVCSLNCGHGARTSEHPAPPEYNFWAVADVSYALFGDLKDFDRVGLGSRFIINWFDFGQSDRLHIIMYGNVAPPAAASENAFAAINAEETGVGLGVSPYYIYGDLAKSSVTGVFDASFKNNTFDGVSLWTYRFSLGFDASTAAANFNGMPLNIAFRASYVRATNAGKFLSVQNVEPENGHFVFNSSIIIPVADKVGLAVQNIATPNAKPVWFAGVVISSGLF